MNCLWHQAGRLQPMPLDPKLLKKVLEEFPLGKSHSKVEKSHPNSKSPTLSSNSAVRSPFSYGQIQALDKIPIFTTMSRLMQSIFLKSYFSSSSIWYLAMDGVAPVAKIKHQLVRRDDQDMLVSKGLVHQNPRKGILLQDTRNGFIAVESLQGSPQMESESEFLFSTRIISPGNTFMSLLDRQCLRIITDTLITQKSNARNTSTKSTSSIFVFDPSTIPGEGDQKIFKAISASRKSNGCSKKNRLIISVDSDILLTVIAQGIDGAQCADPLKFLNSSDSLIFQYDLLISDLKAIFRTEDPNELAKIRTDLVFLVQCGGTDYFPSLSNHQLSFIWKCYLILKTASLKSSVKRDFDCLINRESKSINLREFSLLLKAVLSQSSSTLTEFPSCDDKLCNEVSTYFQCILSHMHLIITNEPFDFYDHYRRQVGPGGCSIQRSFSYLDLISVFGRWMAQGKWTLNLQADIKVDFTEEQIPIISSMFLLGPLRETVLPSFALQIIEEAGLKVPQLFHPDYYHLLWQYYADAMKNHISQMSLQ